MALEAERIQQKCAGWLPADAVLDYGVYWGEDAQVAVNGADQLANCGEAAGGALDRHGRRCTADFQLSVERQSLVDGKGHGRKFDGLETGLRNGDVVCSGREAGDGVGAGGVGLRRSGRICRLARNADISAGDRGTGSVRDGAVNGSRTLTLQQRRCGQNCQDDEEGADAQEQTTTSTRADPPAVEVYSRERDCPNERIDRKSTRLNSSHDQSSYA